MSCIGCSGVVVESQYRGGGWECGRTGRVLSCCKKRGNASELRLAYMNPD